jgi:hypothetical protein
MAEDKIRARMLKLAGTISDAVGEMLGVLNTPSPQDFAQASPEAAQYMVTFYMEHNRWPTWWESYDAGRRQGKKDAGSTVL